MVTKQGLLSRLMSRFRFADAQPQPVESIRVIHADPIGSSGIESYAGYPHEEYLQKLRGMARADIFDEMRRSDYQAKMCLSAVKNPICSGTWEVEPGDAEDAEAKKDAEFIKHLLFKDQEKSFKRFIREAATCVDFGHSVFEITHKAVLNHPDFGSYNGIANIGWRSPRTIDRWNLDPRSGKLVSVSQYSQGDLARMVDIPAEFLMVVSLDQEGDNYEGVSLLRPCYGPWMRKNRYLVLNAIGIEKHAIPTPVAKIPAGKEDSDATEKLETVLRNYSQNHKNYMMYPEGYEIELHSNVYDPEKVDRSVDSEDKRMTKAFLANFLELGMNSVGSYSLSNDLSDFFLGGIEYIAGEIEEGINLRLIKPLIEMNRGPRKVYPTIKCSGISDKAGEELAKVMNYLGGKFITPDDKLEENLRKRYRLPAADPATARKIAPPQIPGNPGQNPAEDVEDDEAGGQSLAERIRLSHARRRAALR